jgi:hypothetical protein
MVPQPELGAVADGQPGDRLAGLGPTVTAAADKALAEAIATTAFDIAHEHCADEGCTAGGLPEWQDITAIVLLAIGEHARIVPKQPAAAARPDLDRLQEIYDSLKGRRPGDQQLPVPNDGPSMHDLVISDLDCWPESDEVLNAVRDLLAERKRVGLERYGSLLQAHNGRDARRDLLEELADAVVYAHQIQVERGQGPGSGEAFEVYEHLASALAHAVQIPEAGRG